MNKGHKQQQKIEISKGGKMVYFYTNNIIGFNSLLTTAMNCKFRTV